MQGEPVRDPKLTREPIVKFGIELDTGRFLGARAGSLDPIQSMIAIDAGTGMASVRVRESFARVPRPADRLPSSTKGRCGCCPLRKREGLTPENIHASMAAMIVDDIVTGKLARGRFEASINPEVIALGGAPNALPSTKGPRQFGTLPSSSPNGCEFVAGKSDRYQSYGMAADARMRVLWAPWGLGSTQHPDESTRTSSREI